MDRPQVLGAGMRSPRAALVLTRGGASSGAGDKAGGPRLWDPIANQVHSANSERVEMVAVTMVFSNRNMWANVQVRVSNSPTIPRLSTPRRVHLGSCVRLQAKGTLTVVDKDLAHWPCPEHAPLLCVYVCV
jgi:hypothetical protein